MPKPSPPRKNRGDPAHPARQRAFCFPQNRRSRTAPSGWAIGDKRPCLVSFFGGGWSSGNPERSIGWAKWAATYKLVGIAPDYRTRLRFQGTPEDCAADGRAAVRWIEDHAAELGIDPSKIIVCGASAGGHVATWTAITSAGPGKNDPAPPVQPAALFLINPVTDTKDGGYGGTKRFDGKANRALACSPCPTRCPRRCPQPSSSTPRATPLCPTPTRSPSATNSWPPKIAANL